MIRTGLSALSGLLAAGVFRQSHVPSLFPLYHVTPFCNLRCEYCEGFPEIGLPGASAAFSPPDAEERYQLGTEDVFRLLAILRRRFDYLFLTGGEPLVRPDFPAILRRARALGFRRVSVNTNGVLLPARREILPLVTDLVLSLDTLDPAAYARVIGSSPEVARGIIDHLDEWAALDRSRALRLTVHTVLRPKDPSPALALLEHCLARRIHICVSPLHTKYRVTVEEEERAAYEAFYDRVIRLKRAGETVSGSYAFYENVRRLEPYRCLPMVIPRILPNGRLLYPCRPRGQVAGSILAHGSWDAAVRGAVRSQGRVRTCRESCRIRCYIEPSLLLTHPAALIQEAR